MLENWGISNRAASGSILDLLHVLCVSEYRTFSLDFARQTVSRGANLVSVGRSLSLLPFLSLPSTPCHPPLHSLLTSSQICLLVFSFLFSLPFKK